MECDEEKVTVTNMASFDSNNVDGILYITPTSK